jgi:hypothetical protein
MIAGCVSKGETLFQKQRIIGKGLQSGFHDSMKHGRQNVNITMPSMIQESFIPCRSHENLQRIHISEMPGRGLQARTRERPSLYSLL